MLVVSLSSLLFSHSQERGWCTLIHRGEKLRFSRQTKMRGMYHLSSYKIHTMIFLMTHIWHQLFQYKITSVKSLSNIFQIKSCTVIHQHFMKKCKRLITGDCYLSLIRVKGSRIKTLSISKYILKSRGCMEYVHYG